MRRFLDSPIAGLRPLRTWILAICLGAVALPALADERADDLKLRRARVMDRLGPDAMLILTSAPLRTFSRDIEYEFRQDSNLYYLTGIDQEETTLVLMPGNVSRKELLFIVERDPIREHWDGRRLSAPEARAISGIQAVYVTREFEAFLDAVLSGQPYGAAPAIADTEFGAFFKAIGEHRARVALVLEPKPALSEPLTEVYAFADQIRARYVGVGIADATSIFRDLRPIKTPYEQKVLTRSLEISSEAQRAGMAAARPGAYEYEVEAAIEQVFQAKGASWGYPSIVGSGPNATILHYNKSSRRMEAGDLLLVDAAATYQYMTGDITRTYPVGGTYSPVQRELYEIVLAAQDQAMKVARRGARLTEVHDKTVEVIKDGLFRLGLITDKPGDQYRLWYTHNSTHYIGLDVHDVGARDRPLEPGMAFVIEPGLYIRADALETLPHTPENEAFLQRVRPAFEKYKAIGVRVEDSFLLTDAGLERLSASVPRTVDEIERFMKTQRATPSAAR